MFENIANFFKRLMKSETKGTPSKETAKERLHLVLMQDRANVSADFLELMKQEIIEVIKKYIEVEDSAIDVRLTNEVGEDGKQGAPSLYANIPILNIKNKNTEKEEDVKENKSEPSEEPQENNAEQMKKSEETIEDEKNVESKEDKTEEKPEEQIIKEETQPNETIEENSINEVEKTENKSE